jgi:hypothetical protein
MEESEPEEDDDIVVRKVGRSKKSVRDPFAYGQNVFWN